MSVISQNAPIISPLMELQADWIDYNGHLNMAFYNVLFDRGCDHAFEMLDLGPERAESDRVTIYTAEVHVCYLREIHLGDRVQATYQIIDHDEKRIHAFQELRHEDGWVSATSETLSLHVNMDGPKVAPFLPDTMAKVEAMASAHSTLVRPDQVGRSIGITRK
ncbi:thioesterase family protein [Pseudahrensia aquimaris]|uniref:Thioesterase family protein n=1 Tax=Pseudahrensia aquimaris TaxID=744461 RepID=A0ABW3FIM4_9HYPH